MLTICLYQAYRVYYVRFINVLLIGSQSASHPMSNRLRSIQMLLSEGQTEVVAVNVPSFPVFL